MAQINIRIDDELKETAEHLFDELGMNISTAFTIFIKQTIREKGIPFTITTEIDQFYNPTNIQKLEHSMKQGKTVSKTFDELEKMANEEN